ncbi:MAG: bifunctional UDP-N-acetylmuramoyl-tripeptide:D-alanyl-D-alanine ligase/alanine racemase [Bacteroidetes bacterium]|nr:bifunctional UDP-N-acetylmuramoyl-tripeptide:D-alanyl-D-alanine ligase/alanine racemase [Bacteroidota bacterium]
MYPLSQIAKIINAQVCGALTIDVQNWQLLIDSRHLNQASVSIFFAIKTSHSDGHFYIKELEQKGVKVFVVDKDYEVYETSYCVLLKVDNVLKALQHLSTFNRNQHQLPVIGITGSNGKTIVKEWLNSLLKTTDTVCVNPKSFNSQIGVPLSVWLLNTTHTMAIFEAGISKVGEMENLEVIIQPSIGVLTHIGSAHDEGFDNINEKIQEKLKLFKNCEAVLLKYPTFETHFKFSETYDFDNINATLNITEVNVIGKSTQLKAFYKNEQTEITIPFSDEASIENTALCWLVILYLNKFNAASFSKLQPISMRLELRQAINNCLLINDSYSNDLNALTAAFSFMHRQSIYPKSTVILSDIEQSGQTDLAICKQVSELLITNKVNRFIGIGPVFFNNQSVYNALHETYFFKDTHSFINGFNFEIFDKETILLKGARSFKFEKIAALLEKQLHGTVLEINLTAAQHNLQFVKSKLPANTKIMAMVKAFAYGSGSYEMAKMLQQKVDYLAVAYADEGLILRNHGIQLPIMVLNADLDVLNQLKSYELEPVVFSLQQLKNMVLALEDSKLAIHIEIDTGMHRLGFTENEIEALVFILLQNKNILVKSIFSHLSASDEPQYDTFTKAQFSTFQIILNRIKTALGYSIISHISNTSAAMRFNQNDFDMVRLGIGLYGIDPSGENQEALENVFTLKTTISQIKTIAANESVGYARMAIENKERKIAILAIGYADGLNRMLSNGKGLIEINGEIAPIVGNICMDMCMVNVSNIQCQVGDDAIVFGKKQSIISLAQTLNTIPYEILTSISQRVKRIYISE